MNPSTSSSNETTHQSNPIQPKTPIRSHIPVGVFSCEQSGNCCTNLYGTEGFGLMLYDWEVKRLDAKHRELFSQPLALEHVYRSEPRTKKRVIVISQIKAKKCPFLDEKRQCRAYADRPLVCRAYPVLATGLNPPHPGQTIVSPTCSGCTKTNARQALLEKPTTKMDVFTNARNIAHAFGNSFFSQLLIERINIRDVKIMRSLEKHGYFGKTNEPVATVNTWPLIHARHFFELVGLPTPIMDESTLPQVRDQFAKEVGNNQE